MSKLYDDVKQIDFEFASTINSICQKRKSEIEDVMVAITKEIKNKNWHNNFKIEKGKIHKDGSAWLNYCMVQNTDQSNIFKFDIDFYIIINARPKTSNDECFELSRKIKNIIKSTYAEITTPNNSIGMHKRAIRLYYPNENMESGKVINYAIDIAIRIFWKEKEITYLTDNNNVSKKPYEYQQELIFKYWETKVPEGFKDAYRWTIKSLKYIYYFNNPNNLNFNNAMDKDKFLSLAFDITNKVAIQNSSLKNKKVKRRLICEEIERQYLDI